MRKSESGNPKAERWGIGSRCAPDFRFPISAFPRASQLAPRALTLIELLVVIVILTTLVAGVIPILSPNNDGRRIREATRGLQTYITMAQAEAARTGRPHGISFRESSPGSGVALEVFQISVPPAFAGFSSNSRVTVADIDPTVQVYGSSGLGNGGTRFTAQYDGAPLYGLNFVLAVPPGPDLFPPRMFRIGDQINVEGNIFLIVDDSNANMQPNETETVTGFEYVIPDLATSTQCIWLNHTNQLLPQGMKRYQFLRQPTAAAAFAVTPGATAEAPHQLPAGIAIDMQGSVTEGNSGALRFPTTSSLFVLGATNTASIMFSPTGGVSSVFLNGTSLTNVSRLVLLLGRVENGGLLDSAEWTIVTGASNDDLSQLQERINWLNLDTRWLSIAASSGRVVVTENAFVDAREVSLVGTDNFETAKFQIEAAHEFAHEMRSAGAGR